MTNMKANEQEQIAIYRIMKDAYKQKFKIRHKNIMFYTKMQHEIIPAKLPGFLYCH